MNSRLLNGFLLFVILFVFTGFVTGQQVKAPKHSGVQWGETIALRSSHHISKQQSPINPTINAINEPADSSYGSQYCRMLSLGQNKWLAVYTVNTNKGYRQDPNGGLRLEIAKSTDNGNTWKVIARLKDAGRDLDNGQLIKIKNGHILLTCRSVRWQSSYRLPVYESEDGGISWRYLSLIDGNEGAPGSLGNPDKGVYEPHCILLEDGRLAVFYANEKHVTQSPSFSQVISEKISADNGKTWGKEIWVAYAPQNKNARPGMPVCTQMKNNKFMVVYEVCGTQACNIYQKISSDGVHWKAGIGTAIPDQTGAPFILAMSDGCLVVTSNRGNISLSRDYGQNWNIFERPWRFRKTYEQDWKQALWPSLYQFGPDRLGVIAALGRPEDKKGHEVNIRFGLIK